MAESYQDVRLKAVMVYDAEGSILSLDCDYIDSENVYSCYQDELPEEYVSFAKHIDSYKIENGALVKRSDTSAIEEEQEKTLQTMMFQKQRASFLSTLPNSEAVKVPYCYPKWASYIGRPLSKLDNSGNPNRIQYDGELWEVRQDIPVVLKDQPPGIDTAALYQRIDDEHAGTYEDPIPYASTMEVYEGKYYIESDIIYRCTRNSGQPLYNSCANLVGIYFEIAEGE